MTAKTVAKPPHREVNGSAEISLNDVARSYAGRNGQVQALDGLSLHVGAGEVVAVVGPSGCGKSTLLELVCGLQSPDRGTVSAGPAVLMPQRDLLLPWACALDNAALPLRIAGMGRDQARDQARPLFEALGLEGFERSRPDELSGGMRQRVAFVRTLMSGKPILALDEPFAGLDALTRQDAQAWLVDALTAQPRTVLLVTHDVEEAVVLADRVVVLSPRPGHQIAALPIALQRPRKRTDPALVALREEALIALGVDR